MGKHDNKATWSTTIFASPDISQDAEWARLTQALAEHQQPTDKRLLGAQDLAWALINSPAYH
jgi:hypothetical protein